MDEARAALKPASPAAGARPDAFGIDDDLESALLAGLADPPEDSDGPAFGANSDPGGAPSETAGSRTAVLDTGASGAAPAPPAGRSDPDGAKEPRVGLPGADRPDPAPEPPPNPASAPSPDLEEASDEALPAHPSSLPEDRNPSTEPAALGEDAHRLADASEASASADGAESSAGLHPRTDPETRLEDRPEAGTAELGAEDGAPSGTVGEPTVLAFATDPESESALREGLSEHPDPQVWPGGLRSAILTLGAGQPSPLLFVDLDETAYPAGAIHELAAVCEVGTVVIAFGSDGTARFSREVLLAGVSDYLVKPITAAAVREAAAHATASARSDAAEDPVGGWSVGFAGTGGSGATTLAGAAALLAAERGRYVSVLDLNRTFPALSFLLDVEPAAGLVELLSTVARASLHPDMVDGMRAERSDRLAVYGYPWSAVPPPCPPVWAICELLVELQRRSHLVLVDGLDDPATRISLLATVDARVVVVEPTVTGAACAARMLTRFGPMFDPDWPFLLVQNHTRPLKPRTGARILRDAGVEATPDVVVPFEPALPAHADRGWPEGRLPRSLRNSFATLVDRILATPAAVPVLA